MADPSPLDNLKLDSSELVAAATFNSVIKTKNDDA